MTNWAVDLIDVHKTYGRDIHALRGVSIQVGRGEIYGLLGPNGAGKSTLVKIMMTVVKPDRIIGTILGRPIGHAGKLARMGYLPENHRYPPYLTGRQMLHYYAALAKVPRKMRMERADELLARVDLSRWGSTKIHKYSKGMMQRLGLAQALMNDPDLVVLDEPTDGVDPVGRRAIRELLIELRQRGKTVFLNSHLLSELEMVCDRVAILVNGMVYRQGTLNELTDHTVEYRIRYEGELGSVRSKIEQLGGIVDRRLISLQGHDSTKLNQVIDWVRGEGVMIEEIVPYRFSLEDILIEVVGDAAADSAIRPNGVPQDHRPIDIG